MDRSWTRFRDRTDLTLEELVAACDEVLADVAPRQTRYAVAERPDTRTIRYYTTRGLLPRPFGYDRGRARYGGAHLLRLAAIKRLQAEHHTLDQIGRALDGLDDRAVERLVAGAAEPEAVQGPAASGDVVLDLHPAGRIVVPREVMGDPDARKKLADNLEQLARLLRATGGSDV